MQGEPVQRRRYSQWAAGWTVRGLKHGRNNRLFFLLQNVQTGPGAHTVFCLMGTAVLSWYKAAGA